MFMVVVSGFFIVVFGALSALHVYWALGGQAGLDKAVPYIDGKPAFEPGAVLTALVAVVLLGCAVIALTLGFADPFAMPYAHLAPNVGWTLAAVFALRAIGDFKLVGFFKKIKDSRFATFDSKLYSPLCVMLSAGFMFLSLAPNV